MSFNVMGGTAVIWAACQSANKDDALFYEPCGQPEDSTELIKDLAPEAAQQLLDLAINCMMVAVHRFEPGLPLYMLISRDGCVLHLSEHHGDCSPGAATRIEATDLDALHAELASKRYKYARPQIEDMPWGTREMSVKDPFSNRLTFTTAVPSA